MPVCSGVLLIMWGSVESEKPVSAITNESFWTNQDDATGVLTVCTTQDMSCGELFTLGRIQK